jgi:DNA polymerase-1
MPPILYLLDGHALAYRAYFALTRGSPSAFTTRAENRLQGYLASPVLASWSKTVRATWQFLDVGRTFRTTSSRHIRTQMPDDLRSQIERMRQLVDPLTSPGWK